MLNEEGAVDTGVSVFDPNAYYVRNETGQKLWYWLPGESVQSLDNFGESVLNVKRKDSSHNSQVSHFITETRHHPSRSMSYPRSSSSIMIDVISMIFD